MPSNVRKRSCSGGVGAHSIAVLMRAGDKYQQHTQWRYRAALPHAAMLARYMEAVRRETYDGVSFSSYCS